MRPFAYARADSVQAVLDLLGQDGAVRPLAGGTDLLTLLKNDVVAPERLVDVKRAADLPRGIRDTEDGLEIGALATLTEIEQSDLVRRHATALAEAVGLAATPQLRNMATLGGNLLQRPRCWYFRHPHVACWLKDGTDCPARDGQNQQHAIFPSEPCVAVHPSDPATALVALDATVRVRGPDGERRVPVEEVFVPPSEARRVETSLRDDEMLLAVTVPKGTAGTRSHYLKAMDRKAWAFALAAVAVRVRVTDGCIEQARLTLGGVAITPHRALAAERALAGQPASAETFVRAAESAVAGAQPLAHNAYKLALVRGLVQQALDEVTASS